MPTPPMPPEASAALMGAGGPPPGMPPGMPPGPEGAPMMGAPEPPMGGPTPPTDVNPEGEDPDFETAMRDLVMSAAAEIDEKDMKVLKKGLNPDIMWVLSKIFGMEAIRALGSLTGERIGQPTTEGSTSPQSLMG